MLRMTRKPGETVVLSGGIVISFEWITDGRVGIGIEAPRSVKILRGELEPFVPEEFMPSEARE